MKAVYKYNVTPGINEINLPFSAQVLDFQMQDGRGVFWALVDLDAPSDVRYFQVVTTGAPIDFEVDASMYIGTAQSLMYVFHLFEVKTLTNGSD